MAWHRFVGVYLIWQVTVQGVPRVRHELASKPPPPPSCMWLPSCFFFFYTFHQIWKFDSAWYFIQSHGGLKVLGWSFNASFQIRKQWLWIIFFFKIGGCKLTCFCVASLFWKIQQICMTLFCLSELPFVVLLFYLPDL